MNFSPGETTSRQYINFHIDYSKPWELCVCVLSASAVMTHFCCNNYYKMFLVNAEQSKMLTQKTCNPTLHSEQLHLWDICGSGCTLSSRLPSIEIKKLKSGIK